MQAESKPTSTGRWQGATLVFTMLLISLLSLDNLQVISLNHRNSSMILQKARQKAYVR